MLPPILLLPPKQPTPPSVHPMPHPESPLTVPRTVIAPMTGAASPTMPASFTSRAPAMALEHSHWLDLSDTRLNCPTLTQSNLPGMRINCHEPLRDHLLSRRINCSAASLAKALPSRRLNCSSAASATNPCIAQHTRCHELRFVLPLKCLAVALQIRARYGLGPHLSEGHH